jgi:homoserine kinase type II
MATPAVTDATSSSEEELLEAAAFFLAATPSSFQRCSGGVNNKVYFVLFGAGDPSFVLRIYNNGANTPRVQYEHAVLAQLAAVPFSTFAVPTLLPTLAGTTYAKLASGADACLFNRIPGVEAKVGDARAIGAATAELVARMAGMTVPLPLPNPLYKNIYDAHRATTRELVFDRLQGAEFDAVRGPADALRSELELAERLVARIAELPDGGLPIQQIHADLHSLNVLTEDGVVTGVLDFEFSAPDWRVMEMAVGLSKYVGTPSAEDAFVQWVDGYASASGRLSATEITLVPDLIILRVLSNVVYFIGRAVAGEDGIEALTSRAAMYADRLVWVRARREFMTGVLTGAVLQA